MRYNETNVRGLEGIMPNFTYGSSTFEYDLITTESTEDVKITVEWLEGITVCAPAHAAPEQLTGRSSCISVGNID